MFFHYGGSLRKWVIPARRASFACLPGINIVVAWFIAFSEWPVLRELELLRRNANR